MTTDTTSNGVDWPRDCQDKALHEGWDIWESSGSSNGPFQLQKVDDPDLIEHESGEELSQTVDDDTDAWVFVRTRAQEGSELHQRALRFIEMNNSLEYARIMKWPEEVNVEVRDVVARDEFMDFDPLDHLDVFPRGRCDGCGLGLTENTTHDETACVASGPQRNYWE